MTDLLLLSMPSTVKLLLRGRCPPTEGPVPIPRPPPEATPGLNRGGRQIAELLRFKRRRQLGAGGVDGDRRLTRHLDAGGLRSDGERDIGGNGLTQLDFKILKRIGVEAAGAGAEVVFAGKQIGEGVFAVGPGNRFDRDAGCDVQSVDLRPA